MKRIKALLELFLTMFKIGLFTFGGGYAMIAVFENEFISRKKWLESDEFLDMIAIAESTPGPIAINTATYIGYKREKILGSVFSTLGMCLPSLIIIYIISLFFNQFLEIKIVQKAFFGIQACVVFLILSAGIKLLRKLERKVFNIVVFLVTFTCIILFSLFSIDFSSIFYIVLSGLAGLIVFLLGNLKDKKKNKGEDK